MTTETGLLWSERVAGEVAAAHRGDGPVVCASGISPSGDIHMGNLREVLTVHFVVEALRAHGHDAVHLHFWDDYDRLRKVPEGVDPAFEQYVGMPLSEIPDPAGEFGSWGERYIAGFMGAMTEMGVGVTEVRQAELYKQGFYNAEARRAMEQRERCFDTLLQFQTPGRDARPVEERRAAYYPFKPYCETCGKDDTQVVSYRDGVVGYRCRCGHAGEMSLADGVPISGKLVWKVDWPMRWHRYSVGFEPAGEDHHAPAGSIPVGFALVRDVFGSAPPHSFAYSFVSLSGVGGKMSSSRGGVITPADALRVLEPAVMRWMYARRLPNQSFGVDFAPNALQRLYDEWDRFAGEDGPVERALHSLCVRTSTASVATPRRVAPFRLLAAVADITQGSREQMGRILAKHLPDADDPERLLDELEPRLTKAREFAERIVPEDSRTILRTEFDAGAWAELTGDQREGVRALAEGLESAITVDELTSLVYSVPKTMLGLPADAEPTPELKKAQRDFFRIVYRLLVSRETGPRLPTLLLSIGPERARTLLTGA